MNLPPEKTARKRLYWLTRRFPANSITEKSFFWCEFFLVRKNSGRRDSIRLKTARL
jgi:hypothetical protein